ncbi:Ni/Fe hydrogenase subunit alpha [Candidatus Bathyarchaeota archaeon ex4484_205]|nr:MAG: Ni/Fe hydrogenase subunit alpha [Candidatus Bathyarchaeota archaeon ex4484_205]
MGKRVVSEYIARVEGQGRLEVEIENDRLKDLRLQIFEPPRFFEAFLVGRKYWEVHEIAARICGICPVAHVITALRAVEKALKIHVSEDTILWRKVLADSAIVQSHALHVYLLAAPDFLGYHSALEMADKFKNEVVRGLRMKRVANTITKWVGGRVIHPMAAVVGGFTRPPDLREKKRILDMLKNAEKDAVATIEMVASFEYPDFEVDYEFVAIRNKDSYAINRGRIVSNKGLNIEEDEYRKFIGERQVPYSSTKHSYVKGRGPFMVGPLARFNLNFDRLKGEARDKAEEIGFKPIVRNPFKSTIARSIEMYHLILEMEELIERGGEDVKVGKVRGGRGEGTAVTEAPRGLLYHAYTLGKFGEVVKADIVPPTAHNYFRIEEDLRKQVSEIIDEEEEEIKRRCEMLVRAYDPCISCSAHFLEITLRRR